MNSSRAVLIAGLLVLDLMLAPSQGRGASPSPNQEAPIARTVSGPRNAWFGGGSSERWVPERRHFFLAAGYAVVTSYSLVNAFWLDGWSATAGGEFPIGQSWTLVPRFHLSSASGQYTGDIVWARLALDGRLSSSRGGLLSYHEAGLGMGVVSSPVSETDASFNSHLRQVASGTPFLQIVTGLRGNPDEVPAFMIELVIALGLGSERPGAFELAAGIEF